MLAACAHCLSGHLRRFLYFTIGVLHKEFKRVAENVIRRASNIINGCDRLNPRPPKPPLPIPKSRRDNVIPKG